MHNEMTRGDRFGFQRRGGRRGGEKRHYPSRGERAAVALTLVMIMRRHISRADSRIPSRERAGSLPFRGAGIPIGGDPSRASTCTWGDHVHQGRPGKRESWRFRTRAPMRPGPTYVFANRARFRVRRDWRRAIRAREKWEREETRASESHSRHSRFTLVPRQ